MTNVFITIDTEYSLALFVRHGAESRQLNFDKSIRCNTPYGDVGVQYQLDMFDRYGLKAVFFVDPMPALIWGNGAIEDVVSPILKRGHDVQLHIHTEWLEYSGNKNPLGDRIGRNIKDFSLSEQQQLLDYARNILIEVGVPSPVAFRAGNYGANDNTLRALSKLGMQYDSSHCPGIAVSDCGIDLPKTQIAPAIHCGVTEVPIAAIASRAGCLRHAQLTALSSREMISAVEFAARQKAAQFTLVSHSFELMSRDRSKINKVVKRRFEALCLALSNMPNIKTTMYKDIDRDQFTNSEAISVLPYNFFRTAERYTEQLVSNQLYGGA
jgi:hypothetical protein